MAPLSPFGPSRPGVLRPKSIWWLFLFVGIAGNAWDMAGLRMKFPDPDAIFPDPVNRRPQGDMAQRRAYDRSEEHTSELQSLMRISYAVFCLKKKKTNYIHNYSPNTTHTTYR